MNSITKVERFRQIKKTIRHDPSYLIIGVDVSKRSSIGHFYNMSKGVLLPKYDISHTREGFEAFLDTIRKYKERYDCQEAIIGVEPTGNYHKVLCEYVDKSGQMIVYVSSVAAHSNRKTMHGGRWGKNDPRDAENVVDLMAQGKILFYQRASSDIGNMRSCLLLRRRLITTRAALKARIRNVIWTCHFPEMEDIYRDAEDNDALTILERCPTAAQIKTMDFNTFIKIFNVSPKSGTRRYRQLVALWNAAQNSVGYPAGSAVISEAQMIARDMRVVQRDIAAIDATLKQSCLSDTMYNQLRSIPGFGFFTAAVFKAIVGDIANFTHPQQLVKLAGLDLEMNQSGMHKGCEQISKKGNALLRYAVSAATNIAVSKNKQIRALFLEKLALRGNTKMARAKLKIKFAEKFIRIAFALLKQNVPFDIHHLSIPVREPVHSNVRA